MISSINLHRSAAIITNSIIVGIIINFAIDTGSDKSLLLFLFYYPALILVNLIVLFVLSGFKKTGVTIYKRILAVLLLLFVPLCWFLSKF